MATDWTRCRVGDLFTLIPGFAFKSKDFLTSGVPVIKIKNVKANAIELADLSFVDESFLAKRREHIIERGDILITLSGNRLGGSKETWVGKVAQFLIPGRYLLNQRVGMLRPKPGVGIDRRCCSYILGSEEYQQLFIAIATSSGGQANLSPNQILGAEILVPLLPEQLAIAYILGTLDDKIKLKRRMNATLEAMARAIFKSWFVDFDPVRAKTEGRDPGLPKPFADLFPDSFEDSELGEIPKGWKVGKLGDVAEHPRRGVQPDAIDASTPYIALEHIPKRCIALSEWGTADGLESNKFEFKRGEILFGKLRPYFHKVGVAPVDGVCSTDIVVVKPSEEHWFGFVLGHVSSDAFVEYTNAGSTGTKMPRTSWSDMSRYSVVLPPDPIAAAFTDQVRPSVTRILAAIHESRTLAALRDTLLPKLISGELRVPDAERISGRHV